MVGAIVAPGEHTVSAILRVMGMQHEPHFQNYHRVSIGTEQRRSNIHCYAIARNQIRNNWFLKKK